MNRFQLNFFISLGLKFYQITIIFCKVNGFQ